MTNNINQKLRDAITYIVRNFNPEGIQRTKLVKLLFLSDRKAKDKLGKKITDIEYIRYHYGPFKPEILSTLEEMDGYGIQEKTESSKYGGKAYRYVEGNNPRTSCSSISQKEKEIIDEVVEKYRRVSLEDILNEIYSLEEIKEAGPLEKVL